jgi:protein-S-isoprenylcysteine O-methyltransferase Ste14
MAATARHRASAIFGGHVRRLLQEIDLPPFWLALFAGAGWVLARLLPMPFVQGRPIGAVLIVMGLVLMGVAALQMVLRHTTFIPRRDPTALVTGGVFALSRNPIYLADALILAGLLLWWDGIAALWLVPAFMVFISRRYILGEEARIAARFGKEWRDYAAQTRRWL